MTTFRITTEPHAYLAGDTALATLLHERRESGYGHNRIEALEEEIYELKNFEQLRERGSFDDMYDQVQQLQALLRRMYEMSKLSRASERELQRKAIAVEAKFCGLWL